MKKNIIYIVLFLSLKGFSQSEDSVYDGVVEMVTNLEENYIYLDDKITNIDCVSNYYGNKAKSIKTNNEIVLLFENLLNEFYDSHIHLNTNIQSSFRLYSPIYAQWNNNKLTISEFWIKKYHGLDHNILNAEIILFNDKPMNYWIDNFPMYCANKQNKEVKEWLANKVIAGTYDKPRVLDLILDNGEKIKLDLDDLSTRKSPNIAKLSFKDNYAIISIENSLGNPKLSHWINENIDTISESKGYIIDLRNTVDGGNTTVAKSILRHFSNEMKVYQKHQNKTTQWVEFTDAKLPHLSNPTIALVGRWTGSMGEGMAVGLEAISNTKVVGTEMERLAGAVESYKVLGQGFSYTISTEKIYHSNGTPREEYVPKYYQSQSTSIQDLEIKNAINKFLKNKH